MKKLLAIAIIFPAFSFAQECRIKKETDPFDRELRLTTGFLSAGSGRVSIVSDKKEIKFLFTLPDNSCFSDTSTALVFFDGVRGKSTYKNGSSMNCEGMFTMLFRNTATTPGVLKKFATQKVGSIHFRTSSGKLMILELDDEEKEQLMEQAACLVEQAKSLL